MAIAEGLGTPRPIAQEHIDTLYERYQNVYGQDDDAAAGAAGADGVVTVSGDE